MQLQFRVNLFSDSGENRHQVWGNRKQGLGLDRFASRLGLIVLQADTALGSLKERREHQQQCFGKWASPETDDKYDTWRAQFSRPSHPYTHNAIRASLPCSPLHCSFMHLTFQHCCQPRFTCFLIVATASQFTQIVICIVGSFAVQLLILSTIVTLIAGTFAVQLLTVSTLTCFQLQSRFFPVILFQFKFDTFDLLSCCFRHW